MPSVTEMLDSVKIGQKAPLSAASIFKNPAESAMGAADDMTGKLSMIPGLDMSSFSASLGGFTSFAQNNVASKLTSLPSIMPMVNAHQAVINSVAGVDGIPNPLAGCGFMDTVMKSLTDAGDMIDSVLAKSNDMLNKAMAGISGAIDFASKTLNETMQWVKDQSTALLNSISSAISGVMKDITALIDSAKKELTDLIAKETKMLSDMVDDLLDFSFLKGLISFGHCGNAVMIKCINPTKVDLGKIAQL